MGDRRWGGGGGGGGGGSGEAEIVITIKARGQGQGSGGGSGSGGKSYNFNVPSRGNIQVKEEEGSDLESIDTDYGSESEDDVPRNKGYGHDKGDMYDYGGVNVNRNKGRRGMINTDDVDDSSENSEEDDEYNSGGSDEDDEDFDAWKPRR